MKRRLPSSLLAALLVCAAAWSQPLRPGPQVLTFFSDVDDTDQPYAIFLPRDYDPARKYPLVVSLHGASSNHRLNMRRVFGRGNLAGETDAEASRYFPRFTEVDMIVVSPLARGTMGYQGIPEKDVYDVMADVKRRFSIDEDRVYLTGLSMGGGGTLWLGLTRPDVWAAIAPVCPHVPPGVEELAPNALNFPVRLFQGDQDPVVPVEVARKWHKRLIDLGVDAEYVEYPNVRHNSWDFAYRNGAIFTWFAKFKRDPHPARVHFVSRAYKYDRAYWVDLDSFTPGALAGIDVSFTDANRLEVQTSNLDGFTLRLAGHPRYTAGKPVAITVDGAPLRVRTAPSLSFAKSGGVWKPGKAALQGKREGAEGPVRDAVSARHIYVYGTADFPGPEELSRRRQAAERAAEWSEPRSRLMLSLPVKADREINDSDRNDASLFLFGSSETNRIIAQMAGTLPLALNPGAADYGLVFVFPAGKHYVVVNSGLPFWTGSTEAKRGGYQFAPPQDRVLSTFGEFILFKGSLASVVAEGRFDRNWKLPPAAAAAMSASGTVSIH